MLFPSPKLAGEGVGEPPDRAEGPQRDQGLLCSWALLCGVYVLVLQPGGVVSQVFSSHGTSFARYCQIIFAWTVSLSDALDVHSHQELECS